MKPPLLLTVLCLLVGLQALAQETIVTKDGFWTFEKVDNSAFESKDPYNPLNKSFIQFNGDRVYISYIYIESVYSLVEIGFEDFYMNKLSEDVTSTEIKHIFKQMFDIEMEDTLLLCQPKWNPNPRDYFLVFPNKIIMVRSGDFFAGFVKNDSFFLPTETDSFGGVCVEKPIEMGSVHECVYSDKNMNECYNIMFEKYARNAKHLRKTPPKTNVSYESHVDEEDVYIVYDYRTPEHLYIEMSYGGGVTTLEIIIKDGDALLRVIYSAD
jgi:hypothetical protein